MPSATRLVSELSFAGDLLAAAAWKTALLVTCIAGIALLLSRRSAAARHAVWMTALACTLVLPLLELSLPAWSWRSRDAVDAANEPLAASEPIAPDAPPAKRDRESNSRRLPVVLADASAGLIESPPASAPGTSAALSDPAPPTADPIVAARQVQKIARRAADDGIAGTLAAVPWQIWLLSVWLAGASVMLVRLAIGALRLERLRFTSRSISDGQIADTAARLAAQLGLQRRVGCLIASERTIPMTWGIARPVILLPAEAESWPAERLRVVLLHELAHVARGDCLALFVSEVARAVYWFHPLVSWCVRQAHLELERACDDRVLSAGARPDVYAEQLLTVTARLPESFVTSSVALAMGRAARIGRRLESILDGTRDRQAVGRLFKAGVFLTGLALCAAVAGYEATARPASAANAPESPSAADTAKADSTALPSAVTTPAAAPEAAPAQPGSDSKPAAPESLAEIRTRILKAYVKSADERALTEAAIKGMLQSLNDPHSEFLPGERFRDFQRMSAGNLVGIGAQMKSEGDQLLVLTPLPDSPALRAGLLPRDAIVAIDGKPVKELGFAEAIEAIRGPAGSVVNLQIIRAEKPQELKIVRAQVPIRSVKGLVLDAAGRWNYWLDADRKIGYAQLNAVLPQSPDELRAAVSGLADLKGLVLDLRGCPGGHLTAAADVVKLFLAQGLIVTTKSQHDSDYVIKADGGKPLGDFPLMVLVNDQTASAAEIVAGALLDNGRAVVLGTRTHGKGSVQTIFPVEGTAAAMKLTTARLIRPNGQEFDRAEGSATWGIDPTDGYFMPLIGDQQAAWLKRRLEREIIGAAAAVRAPAEGQMTALQFVRFELEDPQLAAALTSMTARLTEGAFVRVGKSLDDLKAHYARQDQLRKQRDELKKALEQVDKELESAGR